MARAGFNNDVIAAMKESIGESYVEKALERLDAKWEEKYSIHQYRHDPIVYYMRMDRLVKIGTTANILMRSSTIMPQGVLAVEWGDRKQERWRHGMFWDYRSHGEWFWLREPLWEHIQKLREEWQTKVGASVEEWLAEHGVRPGYQERE